MNYQKEIERFQARDDDGNEYTVIVIQEFVDASTIQGSASKAGKRMTLCDGSHVNYIDAETFKVVENNAD